MSEKKNIVIKVKYPSSGKKSANGSPGVATEWDFKRIGLALGSVLLALMGFFYFTDSDDKQPAPTASTSLALPEQAPETKPQTDNTVSTQVQPKTETHKVENDKSIARAQLTSDIKKNEPTDKLKVPLRVGKKETLWIYYFVELKGMKGKTVYHEWWLNGSLVSRKKVNISGDPWRTASKQLITFTTNNDWIVRVVDDSRNTLSEKTFGLELK
jgi:hypothetical protein